MLLVSLSVDPEHDTPAVLDEYAQRFGADPDRWWFLTGDRATIYELIRDRFKLSVMENPATDPDGRGEAIAHSDRLALVDRGQRGRPLRLQRPRGPGDPRRPGEATSNAGAGSDPARGQCQPQRALRPVPDPGMDPHPTTGAFTRARGSRLAGNGGCSLEPPRRPGVRGHILCMTLAVLTSALFLTCYLVYHYHAGSVPFHGVGACSGGSTSRS